MTILKKITFAAALMLTIPVLAQPPGPGGPRPEPTELGSMPTDAQFPTVEFVFEERVTLGETAVVGDTALGHRQLIRITGGTVTGPKLNGRVVPGGWDYQRRFADGCGTMSADYFLETDDGVLIRILNDSANCFGSNDPEVGRSYFQPTFEAPEGKYGWMTRGTFVATLEGDFGGEGGPAIRIKVYQIK